MKATKKLRDQILNRVAAASQSKMAEHCPAAFADLPPEAWPDDGTRERFDLITDLTTAIESDLWKMLNAMIR